MRTDLQRRTALWLQLRDDHREIRLLRHRCSTGGLSQALLRPLLLLGTGRLPLVVRLSRR